MDTAVQDPVEVAPEPLVLTREEGTAFSLQLFASADVDAPVLLVQPAMGVKAGYYRPLAEALRDRGFHVAVAELRGHETAGGRRPGRNYDFGYHEMLTEDWPLAVAAVKSRFPGSPLYLLGHSLGGQLSSLYAAHHPEEIAGLILIASSSVYWRLWSLPFLGASQLFVVLGRLIGHFPGHRVGFAGREARSMMADWARLARTGRFLFGKPRRDHDGTLARLQTSVLAVTLEGDGFAPARAMDGLLAKFPRVSLTRHHLDPKALGYQGIDHFRWVRQPGVVVPTVVEWLRGQGALRSGRATNVTSLRSPPTTPQPLRGAADS